MIQICLNYRPVMKNIQAKKENIVIWTDSTQKENTLLSFERLYICPVYSTCL